MNLEKFEISIHKSFDDVINCENGEEIKWYTINRGNKLDFFADDHGIGLIKEYTN